MGRKPLNKERIHDPVTQEGWVLRLIPVFQKNGIKQYTMKDLATLVGVSKATLYKHFSSKEEILEMVINLKLRQLEVFKEKLFDDQLPYLERYIKAIQITSLQIGGISNKFILDLRHLHPNLWERIRHFQEEAIELLKQFYQKGIQIGVFNDISPIIMVASDRSFFSTLLDNPEILTNSHLTVQEAFQDYFFMKCNGIIKSPLEKLHLKKIVNRFADVFVKAMRL